MEFYAIILSGMDLNEILSLQPKEQVEKLSVKPYNLPDYNSLLNEYDPEKHSVHSVIDRPFNTFDRVDDKGNEVTVSEDVNRVSVPFQKTIVNRAVGFLLGNPVKLRSSNESGPEKELFQMVKKTYFDNKIQYFDRRLARAVKSECEAAELWYLTEDPVFWNNGSSKFKLRVNLLSPSKGDTLYPLFDEYGDMVAFSRAYVVSVDGKPVDYFDTYTADAIIYRSKDQGGEWQEKRMPNQYGKIPVIYYHQNLPEWNDVQAMIERYETLMSNFADTNDYFGSPMVKTTGNVISLPEKDKRGKVIQMELGGNAEYMAWQNAPEAIKLEFEQLEKMIYTMTQTPDISFSQMKGLGSSVSGFAIKLLFTDAHLKVENDIELYGEMFQRRVNLIKSICGNIINVALSKAVNTLEIEPIFDPYLPRNTKEDIETLSVARGNKAIISNQTAVENNPYVSSVEQELKRMEDEINKEMELAQQELTGTFNP